ncbi:CPXV052 protein [Cowpox virus]|uniref:Protein OPG049 n=1 Tax=Cowpox virus TaxID=10243 RepID=A0A212Q3A1_COWPX|nr:CPXV052 protein [Cowpox virus]
MGTNVVRAFIILYLLAVCGCIEYDMDDNVHICTHTDVSHINHTLWYYNDKVIALATEDKTSGYISSFIKRVNISLTCLNISSLRYEDSGTYKGVSHLKDGVIVTTTMNISVKANIIDLNGSVRYITRSYCEVKIRCEIKSFTLNGSTTPPVMILGTLDKWKYLPFPTDDYRYVGELKRYISGNPYPTESLALEISSTFNRFTIVKNLNEDEFSCYLFSQNYSFHKMLNVRHICESEWEALNNNNNDNANASSMSVSNNNLANDLSSIMTQLQNNYNDDDNDNEYSSTIDSNTLIVILLITMISVMIIIIAVIAAITMYKRARYNRME